VPLPFICRAPGKEDGLQLRVIFRETIVNTLKPKTVLFYLLIIEGLPLLAGYFLKIYLSGASGGGQFLGAYDFFLIICGYWLLGLPLVNYTFFQGLKQIADERQNGTLLLLVSKPLKRWKIILGKWLGLLVSSVLLGICAVFLAITLMTLVVFQDERLIYVFFKAAPLWGLYLLFIAVCLTSVSIGLSVLLKSTRAAFLIFFLFTLLIYPVMPLIQSMGYRPAVSWELNIDHFGAVPLPALLFILLLCIGFLAFTVKKFHDQDITA